MKFLLRIRLLPNPENPLRRVRCLLVPRAADQQRLELPPLDAVIAWPAFLSDVKQPTLVQKGEDHDLEWLSAQRLQPFVHARLNDRLSAAQERAELVAELQRLREDSPTGETGGYPRLAFLLDHLYRSDGALLDLAGGNQALVFAALSGFVFEATVPEPVVWPGAASTLQLTPPDSAPEYVDLVIEPDIARGGSLAPRDLVPEALEVVVEQYPAGFTFRFEDDPHDSISLDEARVRVTRWVGAGRVDTEPHVAELGIVQPPVDEDPSQRRPAYQAADPLEPEQLVGQQLEYGIELINRHGRTTHVSNLSVIRERLDRPRAASGAAVRLHLTPDGPPLVSLEVLVPTLIEDGPANIKLALLAQDHPLYPTGFYGDLDDLALLEGLRALDLTWEESPQPAAGVLLPSGLAAPSEDAALARAAKVAAGQLRGDWATMGVAVLGEFPLAAIAGAAPRPGARLWLTGVLDVDALPAPGRGRRYAVALFRDLGGGVHDSRAVSPLTPCSHQLLFTPPDAEGFPKPVYRRGDPASAGVEVFQLERIEAGSSAPWFLEPSAFMVREDDQAEGPAALRLEIDHRPERVPDSTTSAPFQLGGYRLWVRDIVAVGDPAPFQKVDLVEVLPPLVNAYRPLEISPARIFEARPAGAESVSVPATEIPDLLARVAQKLMSSVASRSVPVAEGKPQRLFAQALSARREALLGPGMAPVAGIWPWRFMGEVLQALRESQWAIELVLKLDVTSDLVAAPNASVALVERLQSVLEVDLSRLVVLLPTDADARPFARLVILPWLGGAEVDALATQLVQVGTDARPIIEGVRALLAGPNRIWTLREAASEPRVVAFDRHRVVRYLWAGLEDRWHHELEWAIECVDRYAMVRARMAGDLTRPGAGRTTPADEVPPAVRKAVSVARRAEVIDRVSVVPVQDGPRCLFRIVDMPERRYAAFNALNRTRFGALESHFSPRRSLIERKTYETWFTTDSGSTSTWVASIAPGPSWKPWLDGFAPRDPPPPPVLSGDDDLLELIHEPAWYEVELSAWCTADGRPGKVQQASQRRAPAGVAFTERPELKVTEQGEAWSLTLSLRLPPLASGLSPAAWTTIAALGKDAPLAKDYAVLPADLDDVPVHLLPDLAVEIHFWINAGRDAVELEPLISILGPAASTHPGTSPPGNPLGLLLRSSHPAFVVEKFKQANAKLDLVLTIAKTADPRLIASLGSAESQICAQIRRGSQSSSRVWLLRKD